MEDQKCKKKEKTESKKIVNVDTSEHLINKIKEHILIRKVFLGEKHISNHSWAEEAIREKIESEKSLQTLLKTKVFTFLLDTELEKIMNDRIEISKQFTRSCSRKKWVLDAFLQKIENERDEIRKYLDKPIDKKD